MESNNVVTRKRNTPDTGLSGPPLQEGTPSEEWRHQLAAPTNLVPLPNGHGDELEPDEELSPADRVAALLSDIGENDDRAVVKVLRQNESGRFVFCADYSPQDFESGGLMMVRKQWGSGTFRICLYGYANGPGTHYGIRKRETIELAAPMPGAELPPSMAPGPDPSAVPPWVALLLERLTPAPAVPAPPPVDPMTSMRQTFELMTMMRTAMGMDRTEKKSTVGELMDAIKELRGASDLLQGKDAESREPSLLELGSKVVDVVGQAMAQRNNSNQVPAVAVPPALAAPAEAGPPVHLQHAPQAPGVELPAVNDKAGAVAVNQPTEAPTPEDALAIAMLQAYLAELVGMASRNEPHAKGVQFIVEKMPDDIVDAMELDAWWTVLVGYAPQVAPHQAWMTAVRDLALQHPDLVKGD